MSRQLNRRQLLCQGLASTAAASTLLNCNWLSATSVNAKPTADPHVVLPKDRIPLSFIIDDSTCLVNMGHFCTPQFAACYPDRAEYKKNWRQWPREIPDDFVRRFGQWCADHGVRGKYSIVPNPAGVGWLDRGLPGWSQVELERSLALVRELMMPHWDIHPEMITHTQVIDLKTGRPFAEINPSTMENSFPQTRISTDQLAEYLAYALKILKNCGLACEGITTPGGFGNLVKDVLPHAVRQAVTDVFPTVEIPHYFKYVVLDTLETAPKIEALQLDGSRPALTVNVPAGTGDWFGGWQGDVLSEPDKYASEDALSGRMVQLIEAGCPALMLCHWPGMYSNGSEEGFQSFQRVVTSLANRFADRTQWMKLSEIARYWAVKQLCSLNYIAPQLQIESPFACIAFTVKLTLTEPLAAAPTVESTGKPLRRVREKSQLDSNTYWESNSDVILCLDISAGVTRLNISTGV